jgi:hypothetical protein
MKQNQTILILANINEIKLHSYAYMIKDARQNHTPLQNVDPNVPKSMLV